MRRDYVTLDVRYTDPDGNQRPAAVLTVEESTDLLGERLVTTGGERLGADRIDVAFRLQTPVDDDEAVGVFSLSNRVTGEFVLEVNTKAGPILDLVETARDGPDGRDACYRVVVRQDDEEVTAYEKETLLVYDEGGNLLRQHSLIPSGVEL
jgi:hypothetical protein